MLAAIFIQGGIAALRSPQAHVQQSKPLLDAVKPVLEQATDAAAPAVGQHAASTSVDVPPTTYNWANDDELLVRIDGGVKLVAGTMLALGKAPRLASTALAASLIPTTLAGHRFWEESDPEAKATQQVEFLKNLGMLGGLLIAAADTEGRPSLGWRGRKAAKLAAAAASAQADVVSGAVEGVTGRVSDAVQEVSGKVSGAANDASGTVAGIAAGAAGLLPAAAKSRSSKSRSSKPGLFKGRSAKSGPSLADKVSDVAGELGKKASDLTDDLSKKADKAAARAAKRGIALQKAAEKRAAQLQKQADKQSSRLQRRASRKGDALAQRAERKRVEAEKKGPGFFDQVVEQAGKLGKDVAARASAVGAEVSKQADGVARDTEKRVEAVSR